jgi:hypothetical protein
VPWVATKKAKREEKKWAASKSRFVNVTEKMIAKGDCDDETPPH